MSNINYEYVVEYLRSLVPERKGQLKEMEEYAEENHVPIIEPESAQFLKMMIVMNKPKRILEIGTAIAYSAIIMVETMGEGSKVTTLERNEKRYNEALKNIEKRGFEDNIEVLYGDAKESLLKLRENEEKYDMIFVDAAKGKYMEFFEIARDMLNKGGIIVSDNVLYKGMIATDELAEKRKKTIIRRMRDYLTYISDEEKFDTAILPIGDGVAITKFKEE